MDKITVRVNQNRFNTSSPTTIKVLDNNYLRITNKPSINGVTILGDMKAGDLNLLSTSSDQHQEISIKSANKADFLLIQNSRQTQKIKLGDITKHFVYTADKMPTDLEVGNYVFIKKEGK